MFNQYKRELCNKHDVNRNTHGIHSLHYHYGIHERLIEELHKAIGPNQEPKWLHSLWSLRCVRRCFYGLS